MKSKTVAISAISAGFVAIILTLGAYIEFADVFMLAISSVFVLLPLYLNSYKGSVLAFIVGGVIAFLVSGFNILSIVFPAYFGFFGIFPIVQSFMEDKKVKKAIAHVIGLVWCVIAVYAIYLYYTFVMGAVLDGLPAWIINNIWIIVGVVAVVFYFVFERFVRVTRRFTAFYLQRIIKK